MGEWKAGLDELNQFELKERRAASFQTRLNQLDATWRLARELGISLDPPPFDEAVNAQWTKLRKAFHERTRPHPEHVDSPAGGDPAEA